MPLVLLQRSEPAGMLTLSSPPSEEQVSLPTLVQKAREARMALVPEAAGTTEERSRPEKTQATSVTKSCRAEHPSYPNPI